ncbi:MAG TPA: GAF domain-containing protein [Thermomicrobiales bacterium]
MARSQTALIADVGVALNARDALPDMLRKCTEAVVRQLDAAFARIWTLDRAGTTLELRASAGLYTHLDGGHSRVPVGMFKIGLIAAERLPHLTNDVRTDPRVSDPEWAAREGMVAFAGYPLIVEDRLVGVLAMFARQPLGEETIAILSSVAQMVATGIARKEAEEELRADTRVSEALYRIGVVLSSELDLQKIVQAVTDAATTIIGAQFGAFFYNVFDAQGASYMLYTLSGVPREAFENFPMPRATDVFGPTFRGEGVVRLDDVARDPRYGNNAPYYGMPEGHLPVRSYLAAPVFSRSGDVLGGLFFGHATPGAFDERAERVVVSIAAQAAIAMDNARLLGAAQAAEARFRTLFQSVPDAILVADASARLLDANPAAVSLLGRTHEELRTLSVPDIVAAERAWTEAEFGRFVQDGVWRSELDLRRGDGTLVPVEAQASAVALPDGTIYLSVLRDISERRQHDQQRQDFIAMVAHDLKNPLTTMKGYAQLLQRRGAYSERNVATIVSQANRLERLIDDLRDVARIDAGQLALDRAPVDLAALVRTNVEESRALSEAHTIDLETPDEPVIGAWDAGRLAQVIENLLSNAVKYSPDGGAIHVCVTANEHEAQLVVIDEGIGIPPEALARVFERFYRSDTGVAANRKGLGLGLYISKALVEAHGGTIAVEPLSPTGSAFSVTLPRESDAPLCDGGA